MIKQFAVLLAAVAAAAVVAAGCGDDEASGGEDTTITTSSLSKAQYVKQANKLCDDVEAKIFKEFKGFRPDGVGKNLNARLAAAVPVILAPATEEQIAELRELGAPKGDEKQIEAMLATMQKEFEVAEQEQESEKSQSPIEFLDGFNSFDKQATKYGIEACAFNY